MSDRPVRGGPPALRLGVEQRLAPDVVIVWRIGYAVSSAALSLALLAGAIAALVASSPGPSLRAGAFAFWGGTSVLLAAHAWCWPALRYRNESFRVLEQGLEIRRGVIWRRLTHVPRSRVQHTDVSRGPVERAFELATLVLFTAGTEHASISLAGLTASDALAIRDHLIGGGEDDAV